MAHIPPIYPAIFQSYPTLRDSFSGASTPLTVILEYFVSDLQRMERSRVEPLLDDLGWSWARLGRVLGVHENTVSKWGSIGVPKYAVAYLELACSVKAISDELG